MHNAINYFIRGEKTRMSINDLISASDYIIIPDTNVFLNVYCYSPEFSEFALECLRKVSDAIYLPSTVRLEYEKHYRGEFSNMKKRVATAGQETEKQITTAKQKILKTCVNRAQTLRNELSAFRHGGFDPVFHVYHSRSGMASHAFTNPSDTGDRRIII